MSLSDGDGLLFLHGAGGSALVWQLQRLAFPRARALDLPGRDGVPPSGVAGYADALRALLDSERGGGGLHEGVSRGPHVVAGHSLGAAIALRWALRYPQEVRGLILIGAGARTRVNPAWLAGIAAGDQAAVEDFGSWWFVPHSDRRLAEKSLALLRATPREVLLADLRASDGFDVMGELDRLALPVLIICGAEDRLTPVKFSRYLHEHIDGSELRVIDGAGHMVMLERPNETNAEIRSYLARLEGVGQATPAMPDQERSET